MSQKMENRGLSSPFFTAQTTCYGHSRTLALKNPDIVEVRKDLFEHPGLWHMEERLCGCCFCLFLRTTHLDAIVRSVVISQVALDDARDSADDTISGRIVLA